MGYKNQVFRGFTLGGFVTFATAAAAALKIFFLARLLSPHDFGLFSLIAVLIGSMESFTETGINTIITQSDRSIHYFLDTAWVISIFRGFVIAILIVLVGFAMRLIYHEDLLLTLAALAAFVPAIRGFINPAVVELYKKMFFFRDSLYRLSLVIVDLIAAICFALVIKSSMAFVLGMVVTALFEVTITFVFFKDRPQFIYLKSRAKEIYHFSRSLNLSAMLSYAVQNVDNLLVGKLINTTALGIYAQGYSLSHKCNLELAKSVQHATFPVYTKITNDEYRLRQAFWKSTLTSLAGFCLISAPLILFPKFIVQVILGGGKWNGVEVVLPLLAVAGLIQSFILLSQNLFMAGKKYFWLNSTLAVNVITLIFFICLMAPNGGLMGAVNAVIISRLITFGFTSFGLWKQFTK